MQRKWSERADNPWADRMRRIFEDVDLGTGRDQGQHPHEADQIPRGHNDVLRKHDE